jgi:diadenosine tetraphosphatase ApaH/serine/threonine PP2A family protein phosphatase
MRLAILSDIHANLVALDAVLAAIGTVDGIRVLGDIVGYGPEPDGVVERLRTAGATGVLGNHDQVAVGRLGPELFNRDARLAIEWTRDRITPETRAWLDALPERASEGAFTLVHGSPRDPTWEYILDERTAQENLAAFDSPYCLFGHTHLPAAFRATGRTMVGGAAATDDQVRLDDRRALLNPGSVGQPRDGDPAAAWALLDTDAATITWRRTPYDIGRTQRAMMLAGLPPRLIVRLSVGA